MAHAKDLENGGSARSVLCTSWWTFWAFCIFFQFGAAGKRQVVEGGGGGLHMRETGTMWQIGVLTGKPCTFGAQMGHFRRFGTTRIRRDFRRVRTYNGTFLLLVSMPPKRGFLLEFTA